MNTAGETKESRLLTAVAVAEQLSCSVAGSARRLRSIKSQRGARLNRYAK
jgi:hypothetical protein